MRKFIYILIGFLLFSCEDVIDVDLNTTPPKLVIDASINWVKGTSGSDQSIRLTLTAPYFDLTVPPATGAQVSIRNSNNDTFEFTEESNSGIYRNNTFLPEIDETYSLEIIYQNETYTAVETLKSVVDIEYVEQNNEGGFSGDETEIKAFYTDPANVENYYFFEFTTNIPVIPSLEVYDDEFNDGNQIFGFYTEEDLTTGNIVDIKIHGVSERFYEYMFILLQQNSEEGFSPFETQPATVRGNCVNETNPNNFPLGYFRLSEVAEFEYIVL